MNIDRLIKQTRKKTDKQVEAEMKKRKTSDDDIRQETDAMYYIDRCKREHTEIINQQLGRTR